MKNCSILRNFVFAPFLLLLAACASIQQPSRPAEKPRSPADLQDWTVRGSMVVTSPEARTHVRFNWQQRDQNYTIDFFGPLGTYHHQLLGRSQQVTLLNHENQLITAATPEALLENTLGWRLPVRHLYYWIRGIPKPAPGWTIQYGGYMPFEGYTLPSEMVLTYADLKIKIKISEWAS